MDTNNVATIFTTKSRVLSNSRRVVLLTRSEYVTVVIRPLLHPSAVQCSALGEMSVTCCPVLP